MSKQLTPEQIDDLYDFCKDHYVHEYEIQTELVDHLATSIENQLEQEPDTSFHKALLDAYNAFGFEGFDQLAKSKKHAFRKSYDLLFLNFLGSFFQLPRIILTLTLTLILFTSLHYLDQRRIILAFVACILITFYLLVWCLDIFNNRLKMNQKGKEKSFLIENYFYRIKLRVQQIASGLNIALILFLRPFKAQQAAWLDLLGSTLIVLLFIIFYALMFYMPKLVKQHFEEQYPQFVKS